MLHKSFMRNHLLSRVDNANGDLELGAREVPADSTESDIIPVFVDGRKKFFQVADPYTTPERLKNTWHTR